MNDTHLKHIGQMIKTMRKHRKMSQDTLADKTALEPGVTKPTVTRVYIGMLERGSVNPSVEVLMKLATALECSLDITITPIDDEK